MTIDLKTTELRDHQIEGLRFLLEHNRRAILADVAGAGKTVIVLNALFTDPKPFPVIIAVNRPGLSVWENELLKWYKEPSVIYAGTPKERTTKLQEFITTQGLNFLITTYAMIPEIMSALGPEFFNAMVLDEYHLFGCLNRKTKTAKFLKTIAKAIPHLIMLTGTPMRQNPSDWYYPISLIDPSIGGYWDFVREYCITIRDRFGISIERLPQNEEQFKTLLKKYRRRYTDKSHLPPMTRQPIPVEMTKKQRKLYDQLVEKMYIEEDGSFIITPNKLTMVLRCRQLLVTPRLLDFNEDGEALSMLKPLVTEELSEGNPVIIFTPFRQAIKYIEEKVSSVKPKPDIYIVHGGMEHQQHKAVQAEFQSQHTKNKVLIATIKSGTTMTLTEANAEIFLGYELSLHDNEQAEARAWRESQKHPVRAYYFLYRGNPVDERGLQILNEKAIALGVDGGEDEYYRSVVEG